MTGAGAGAGAGSARLAKRVRLKDAHVITRMADIAAGLDDVIRLGRGDPDLATPAHIVEAGQAALGRGETHYGHPLGLPALREAIAADILARGGAAYAPDEIVVTPGGQHAMFVAALALLDPGDEMVVPSPGYEPYRQAAELADARVVPVPTGFHTNFTPTAAMIEAVLTPRSKLLVLVNPNNPTGTVTPPDEVERIARLATSRDLLVVSDEIYARLVFGNQRVQPVAALPGMRERTITLSGFSKAYAMTGWRVGYFAAPRELAVAMGEINHAFAICTAAVSQHAALAALAGPQDCVEDMRRTYDERRRALCEGLDSLGIRYAEPEGGFYVWADVSSTGLSAAAFCERLLADGRVMVFPGSIYGDPTGDFVRLTLTQGLPRIREAIGRMRGVVEAIRAERQAPAA